MTVFGGIGHVASNKGLAIFELTLVALVCLEKCLHFFQKWAEDNDYSALYEKMKNELLQLGIISFALFLGQAAGADLFKEPEFELAFETAHVIILFIAFAFVVQGFFLVQVGTKSIYITLMSA